MEPFPLLRNGCLLTANISQRALLEQCKGLRKDAGQVLMYCQAEERGHAAQRAGCAPHWGLRYEIAVCPWTSRSPLAPALGIGFFIYSVRGFFNVLVRVKILLFYHGHAHPGWAEELLAPFSEMECTFYSEAFPKHECESNISFLRNSAAPIICTIHYSF